MDEKATFQVTVEGDESKITINESNKLLLSFSSVLIFCCTLVFVLLSASQTDLFSSLKSKLLYKDEVVEKSVSTSQKPNIIFIVADDLGWNSLGKSYNDEAIDAITTNLTVIANTGIYMTNYYSQEVCTPARASLLTGRYPLSIGMQYDLIEPADEWGMDLSETTIAEVLQDAGYSTYMLGKWHLGHYAPDYLPTARGFDRYIGYLAGQGYYWSKMNTEQKKYKDFMSADSTCYSGYNGHDLHEYSTYFYTNHAIDIIDNHADSDTPFFMYLAYQAVHDPYYDVNGQYSLGVPDEYIPDDILATIHKSTPSSLHKEYLKSLYLLDKGVGQLYQHLIDTNKVDNTYVVFTSDNGGCYASGGFNGPLRGTKGSLFEGGIKVDAFIASPLLTQSGFLYDNLFHASDWFPTLLSLAGVSYDAPSDLSLDGIDHSDAFRDTSIVPRTSVLHNMYSAVDNYFFDMWTNGSFAIRNTQYKLMHTFNSSIYAKEYNLNYKELEAITDDGHCAQSFSSANGPFTVSRHSST